MIKEKDKTKSNNWSVYRISLSNLMTNHSISPASNRDKLIISPTKATPIPGWWAKNLSTLTIYYQIWYSKKVRGIIMLLLNPLYWTHYTKNRNKIMSNVYNMRIPIKSQVLSSCASPKIQMKTQKAENITIKEYRLCMGGITDTLIMKKQLISVGD